MTRDMDLIRKILFEVESMAAGSSPIVIEFPGEYDQALVNEHVDLMIEAGLLKGRVIKGMNGVVGMIVQGLTWDGHDFLDSIRDPEVWAKTKRGAEAAGGFTVDLLKDLAKGFIKTKIEEHTGVKL